MAIYPTKRELKDIEQREHIIQSSQKLFDQYGFKRVTMDDICRHAAIGRSVFYRHFNGKDDLYMIYLAKEREEFLLKHYVYDEKTDLRILFTNFFSANFEFNRQYDRVSNRIAYISYIQVFFKLRTAGDFYGKAFNQLIQRGIQENRLRMSLSPEEHFIVMHDWLIGFLIGWSIRPENQSSIEDAYDKIVQQIASVWLKE